MRALILIHRWLGIAFCLLFAMWFATGIVMHFIAFPDLTEAERVAGLSPIYRTDVRQGPAAAVTATGIRAATRVRLFARPDGPVYLVQGATGMNAVRATDFSPAGVKSESLALAIATDHARRRGMNTSQASFSGLARDDQWTVPNGLDPHRPLYRIALNDGPGTELYVSSTTGEVVRDTTRTERRWNYAGSVLHWIYPTALRRNGSAWNTTVWVLSLVALIAALAGAVLGILQARIAHGRIVSPYRSWHAWHHWLGLSCMAFVLTWIFSGWLSMDQGLIFSNGKPTAAESVTFTGAPAWDKLPAHEIRLLPVQAREIEWFAFDGRIYRRERVDLESQRLSLAGDAAVPGRAFLRADEVTAAARHLGADCNPAVVVDAADDYPVTPTMPGAPVYRTLCGKSWFHTEGANGAMLEKLDASRRAYRWLYSALHTLDFPVLTAHPVLRSALIVMLCGLGLAFSSTAVVIGWRRLRRSD